MSEAAALKTPGPVSPEGSPMPSHSTCSVGGCERRGFTRGWCGMHYRRWLHHGDPQARMPNNHVVPPSERFWKFVDKSGDCWIWTGAMYPGQYGMFALGGNRKAYAHRVAYEMIVGPIQTGLELDHLCRVHPCVRPEHLEPVTPAENVRRGLGNGYKLKTHCPNGHPYSGENLYLRKRGGRGCRACLREQRAKYERKQKDCILPAAEVDAMLQTVRDRMREYTA